MHWNVVKRENGYWMQPWMTIILELCGGGGGLVIWSAWMRIKSKCEWVKRKGNSQKVIVGWNWWNHQRDMRGFKKQKSEYEVICWMDMVETWSGLQEQKDIKRCKEWCLAKPDLAMFPFLFLSLISCIPTFFLCFT